MLVLDSDHLTELGFRNSAGQRLSKRLGQDLAIPHSRVTEIIKGRQGITATTALKRGKYFSTPPEYWLNLQHMHDLAEEQEKQYDSLSRIRPLVA